MEHKDSVLCSQDAQPYVEHRSTILWSQNFLAYIVCSQDSLAFMEV
jgi:hypothetical protein